MSDFKAAMNTPNLIGGNILNQMRKIRWLVSVVLRVITVILSKRFRLECEAMKKSTQRNGTSQCKTDDSVLSHIRRRGEKYWPKWLKKVGTRHQRIAGLCDDWNPSNVLMADDFAKLLMVFLLVPMI
jgi:hypothetical protein